MSKFTLILDSSQITSYLACPSYWYYKNVRKLRLSENGVLAPTSTTTMDAGTYGHKLLDLYYKQRALGSNPSVCLEVALTYDPDSDTCQCGCSADSHREIPTLGIRPCKTCTKCANFTPVKFSLPDKERQLVLGRFRDYVYKYALCSPDIQDFQPETPDHVEIGFSEPIYEDSESIFILEGRIDLLAKLQGLDCVVDHKFQLQQRHLYSKSVQFRNYALIAKKTFFAVNYIRLHKAVTSETLAREFVQFTVPELLAWKQELILIFKSIKNAAQSDSYEKHWSACQPMGSHHICEFTPLCECLSDIDLQNRKMSALYQVQEKIWRPW